MTTPKTVVAASRWNAPHPDVEWFNRMKAMECIPGPWRVVSVELNGGTFDTGFRLLDSGLPHFHLALGTPDQMRRVVQQLNEREELVAWFQWAMAHVHPPYDRTSTYGQQYATACAVMAKATMP